MSDSTVRGLASIIIPCWNEVGFTQQCMAALRSNTRPPWELIVIDNGSTDATGMYLAGLRDMAVVPVTVISNTTNLGFPAAINQGLRAARGEYLVLLNNDVVVTDGWLDQLTALADAKTSVVAKPNLSGQGNSVNGSEAATGSGPPRAVDRNALAALSTRHNVKIIDLDVDGDESQVESGHDSELTPGADASEPTRESTIGLVGPMSNYAAPPQLVERVTYGDMAGMAGYARRWRDDHRGQWFTVPKLSGFCLLMKRAVYDKIGGLDERFGLGFFDDDDIAERARRAGFELAVAHDLFVHHFGSRTFAGNGIDTERLLNENAGRFAAKWGLRETGGRRVSLRPFAEPNTPVRTPHVHGRHTRETPASQKCLPELPPLADADRARVSLTMIVKNEEQNLGHCLESVRGLFDEIVIVDTGSTDRTVEIARSFGANVCDFAWVDSFSAARNEALAHATGHYAFWLDADDVVEPVEQGKLRGLLGQLKRCGEEAAYVVRCACDPSPDGTGGETVVDHIRLFPLREGVRWSYRVHEQILPALNRARVPVRWTDLTVRHTGYVDQALRARKLERDFRLLGLELQDRPDDPFTLFNLGALANERHDWRGALGYLERSLALSAPTDSIVRKLFALIARSHQSLGDSQEALRTCARGLEVDAEDAELWFRKAVVHRFRGESAEAERSWRLILGLRRPNRFCSVDQGIFGHLTRRNLAVLAAERGDLAEVEQLWNDVLTECPGDREALAHLERLHERNAAG